MAIKKHIPNAITCCNLICGCLAIVEVLQGNLESASFLVGLAAVFDFFDGFAARMLRVTSPIGKDLDSLADMVTFGVVPGMMVYQLLSQSLQTPGMSTNAHAQLCSWQACLPFVAFLIIVFSAIRLAKFNNDTRQTTSFVGLPTPANAILICSLPLILEHSASPQLQHIILNPFVLVFLTVGLSYLLVAEIPLFALKFRNFSWNGNRTRYTFLLASALLLALFRFTGIPLIILLYVLMSINSNYFAKRKERH